MNDWFEWNGVRCTEYGIRVSELPKITFAAERSTFVEIPGRSGSLTTLEGDNVYDDITLSATCYVEDLSKVNRLAGWLHGSGTVTFANRQGGVYYARIINQISFDKIIRGNPACSFAVNFRCKPFFYPDAADIELIRPGSVINPCGFDALPIITVYGDCTGETLMVGGASVLLNEPTDHITLDCENMLAYIDSTNASGGITLVDDEWPVLEPGTNMINWTSGITKVTIRPQWRTL